MSFLTKKKSNWRTIQRQRLLRKWYMASKNHVVKCTGNHGYNLGYGWFRIEKIGKIYKSDIQIDHIKRVGSHPELGNVDSNTQALCPLCHVKKDSGFKFRDTWGDVK